MKTSESFTSLLSNRFLNQNTLQISCFSHPGLDDIIVAQDWIILYAVLRRCKFCFTWLVHLTTNVVGNELYHLLLLYGQPNLIRFKWSRKSVSLSMGCDRPALLARQQTVWRPLWSPDLSYERSKFHPHSYTMTSDWSQVSCKLSDKCLFVLSFRFPGIPHASSKVFHSLTDQMTKPRRVERTNL
jgi:hypothetical protein